MRSDSPIRLAVLDDNLFVRTADGEVRPLASTFHRFVEAVARTGAFGHLSYVVPLRDQRIWEVAPVLDPVDESVLEIVPTEFFGGIADYLLRLGWLTARNAGVIARAVSDADLVWLRLPASNALLALAAARRSRTPTFGWVAGSARDVARARRLQPPLGWVTEAIGAAYDEVTALAGKRGPLFAFDAHFFASVVSAAEVSDTRSSEHRAAHGPPWRLAWAGRMAVEKGLPELIEAVRLLRLADMDVTLTLLGEGPARPAVERALAHLPPDRVEDYGHVGNRARYVELLRSADVFVQPSLAESVPKTLVDALACGLPTVATAVGGIPEAFGHGLVELVPRAEPDALASAIRALLLDPERRLLMRERGLEWADDHTAEAQARRLVTRLRNDFSMLDWPAREPTAVDTASQMRVPG